MLINQFQTIIFL